MRSHAMVYIFCGQYGIMRVIGVVLFSKLRVTPTGQKSLISNNLTQTNFACTKYSHQYFDCTETEIHSSRQKRTQFPSTARRCRRRIQCQGIAYWEWAFRSRQGSTGAMVSPGWVGRILGNRNEGPLASSIQLSATNVRSVSMKTAILSTRVSTSSAVRLTKSK